MKIFLTFLTFFTFCLPQFLSAAITFDEKGKWQTTFNYQECTQRGNPIGSGNVSCANVQNDDIMWNWGAVCYEGNCTQVTSGANNPLGTGNGFRAWFTNYQKESSGQVKIDFSEPQKELWVRWYMRYEDGVRWVNNLVPFNKVFYIRTSGKNKTQQIPSLRDVFCLAVQGSGVDQNTPSFSNAGWMQIYPTGVADGRWVAFEFHIKMDTAGVKVGNIHTTPFNGVAQLWVDGVYKGGFTNINMSEMSSDSRLGWKEITFFENQEPNAVGQTIAHVDFDDIVIYNQPPPNVDAHGNPFIGPIGWTGDVAAPSPLPPPFLKLIR